MERSARRFTVRGKTFTPSTVPTPISSARMAPMRLASPATCSSGIVTSASIAWPGESSRTVVDLGSNRGAFVAMMTPFAEQIFAREANRDLAPIFEHNLPANGVADPLVDSDFIVSGGEMKPDGLESVEFPALQDSMTSSPSISSRWTSKTANSPCSKTPIVSTAVETCPSTLTSDSVTRRLRRTRFEAGDSTSRSRTRTCDSWKNQGIRPSSTPAARLDSSTLNHRKQ